MLLVLLLVSGCGAPLQTPASDEGLRRAAEAQAARLGDEGEHAAAARAWLSLAQAAPAQRQRYQILAARELLRDGDAAGARQLVGQTPMPIQPDNTQLWAEVAGSVLLASGEPERALRELERSPTAPSPGANARLLELRAEALFRLGRPAEATDLLLEREAWLEDGDAITANRRLILAQLGKHADSLTPAMAIQARDPMLAAWLELGLILRAGPPDSAAARGPLDEWRRRFPDHPAQPLLFPERRLVTVLDRPPERIALLLPLSGRQAALGEAVRDGFLAAHYAARGQRRPQITIYDVAALGATAAWDLAIDEGSQLIVGPLLREDVTAVAAHSNGTPALVLNSLPEGQPVPPGMFQFGLFPEDEAAQAARRVVADGRTRGVALIPSNDWGRRMLESFRSVLTEAGGELLEHRLYDTVAADYSFSISEMLLFGESRARHQQIGRILGASPGFTPRRRQDVQFIFLAANAGSGRLVKPQLRFFDAGDIPTYATSAIWEPGSARSEDIEGVYFPDAPLLLVPDDRGDELLDGIERHWSADTAERLRFHALGHDAWSLAAQLAGNPPLPRGLYGLTGQLTLAPDGRIHRELPWAQVRGGEPVSLEAPPAITPLAGDGALR